MPVAEAVMQRLRAALDKITTARARVIAAAKVGGVLKLGFHNFVPQTTVQYLPVSVQVLHSKCALAHFEPRFLYLCHTAGICTDSITRHGKLVY